MFASFIRGEGMTKCARFEPSRTPAAVYITGMWTHAETLSASSRGKIFAYALDFFLYGETLQYWEAEK